MTDLATSTRWAAAFEGRDRARSAVAEPQTYLEVLAGLGCAVDAWETTYLHVLAGEDAIVRWASGTGLRPVPAGAAERRGPRGVPGRVPARWSAAAYPQRPWGTVLPFRRVFVVAQAGRAGMTDRPGLVGLHHVQLAAPRGSEDVLRAFYGELLGMTEVPKPPVLAARGGAWFRAGGARAAPRRRGRLPPGPQGAPGPAGGGPPGVRRAAGGPRRAGGVGRQAFPGYRRCYLHDPHGNRLELLEPLPA